MKKAKKTLRRFHFEAPLLYASSPDMKPLISRVVTRGNNHGSVWCCIGCATHGGAVLALGYFPRPGGSSSEPGKEEEEEEEG